MRPFKVVDTDLWLAQMQLLRDETYKPLSVGKWQIPSGAGVSAIVFSCICLAIVWNTAAFLPCLAICSVKIAAYLTWTAESRRFAALPADLHAAKRYSNSCAVLAPIAGLCWSIYAVMVITQLQSHEHWLYYAIFAGTLLAAACASTLVDLSLHSVASAGFLFGAATPYALVLLGIGNLPAKMLGTASFIYAAMLFAHGLSIKASQVRSLQLRNENQELLTRYRTAKERAEDSDRAKSRFLAAASHDLRQPMQSMSLLVELLDRTSEPEDLRSVVASIKTSTDTLREMLTLILDIASIDAGTIKIEKRPVAVHELIDTVADSFRAAALGKGLTLETSGQPATVFTDNQLLHRIVLNLVSNAIKFTHQGSIMISSRALDEDTVIVDVIDTGAGIEQDKLDLIFEEYYQLDNKTRTTGNGVGLGLAIAAGLAKHMGHILSVQSTPDKGSTFSIELPRWQSDTAIFPEFDDDLTLQEFAKQYRVLIVDDDREVATALQRLLTHWGLITRVAHDLESARSVMRSGFVPTLALVDLRLENDRTGVDVIRYLQRRDQKIRGIILTGDTAPELLEPVLIEEFPLLHKPVRSAELHATMQQQLQASDNDFSDELDDTLLMADH